jgi:hypothetical protein
LAERKKKSSQVNDGENTSIVGGGKGGRRPPPPPHLPTEKYGGVLNISNDEVPVYHSLSQIWQQIL